MHSEGQGKFDTRLECTYFKLNKVESDSKRVAEYAVKAGLPQPSAVHFAAAYAKASAAGDIKPFVFAGVRGFNAQVFDRGMLGVGYTYADSLRLVWYASIAFGCIACVCCAFIPNIKKFSTRRTALDIHQIRTL